MKHLDWGYFDSGPASAAFNMALDESLLLSVEGIGRPVLRFYGWLERAGTFGYSQQYQSVARVTVLRPLIRRPTGGGLVPHDADWTYSLVFPPAHSWYRLNAKESYEQVHQWIQAAFQAIGVTTELSPEARKVIPGQCFVGAEKADVLWQGRKIAGAAQRRTRHGLLIQGSVQPPPIGLERPAWQRAMIEQGGRILGAGGSTPIPDSVLEMANQLARHKFGSASFNQKR